MRSTLLVLLVAVGCAKHHSSPASESATSGPDPAAATSTSTSSATSAADDPPLEGAADLSADVTQLTAGMKEFKMPAYSGGLIVHGHQAAPLFQVTGFAYALGGLAHYQNGRVLALSAEGWLGDTDVTAHADTLAFVTQAMAWLTPSNKNVLLIGSVSAAKIQAFVTSLGYTVTLAKTSLADTTAPLSSFGAVLLGYDVAEADIAPLQAFVAAGGGLLWAAKGWSVKTNHFGGKPIELSPHDRLLGAMGISVSSAAQYTTTNTVEPFTPEAAAPLHFATMLQSLHTTATGGSALDAAGIAASLAEIKAIMSDDFTGRDFPSAADLSAIQAYYQRVKAQLHPTKDAPIAASDLADRAGVVLVHVVQHLVPAASIVAADDAADFPGAVPAGSEHVTDHVTIDLGVTRWHSTGLYAAPGEVITVTTDAAGTAANLLVRIGSHDDRLWTNSDGDAWKRWPDVITELPLAETTTTIASAHGGLIYIVCPSTPAAGTSSTITIANAVRAPHFVLGKTTADEWRNTQRHYPAPWGEVESDQHVYTLPTSLLATIDDPTAGADWWRRAVLSHTDLSQLPGFPYPERYVQDVQVTVGYLHSGYPTTGTDDDPGDLLDATYLASGNQWGELHELGHNRQQPAWTFTGTKEVTVNLFSLYTGSALTGITAWDYPWIKGYRAKAVQYLAHPSFATWQATPGVAFVMYGQIIREFGFQPIKDTFKEYAGLASNQLPQTDDDKRDQWMVRLSQHLGVNLGPFFDMWNVPVSAAAKAQVASLQAWTPLPINVDASATAAPQAADVPTP